MLTMEPVKSSNLAAMAFDSATRELHVSFVGKVEAIHKYLDVPPEIVAEMKAAPSIGVFFAREIKTKFTHVPPAPKVAAT